MNNYRRSPDDNGEEGWGVTDDKQGVPLTAGQKEQAKALDKEIEAFEGKLTKMSNAELKDVATKLEQAERAMLLEKIDAELKVMKDTVLKPGDGAASASAAAAAGSAAVVVNEPTS
jgi:hypothetical protein